MIDNSVLNGILLDEGDALHRPPDLGTDSHRDGKIEAKMRPRPTQPKRKLVSCICSRSISAARRVLLVGRAVGVGIDSFAHSEGPGNPYR